VKDVGNRLFTALLIAVLTLFLAGVILLLSSNLVYLVGADGADQRSGWQVLLAAFSDPEALFAVKLSFVTAGITTILSLLIGIPTAYILSRHRLPGAALIDTLLDLPIVLPPPVVGISLLVFFSTELGAAVDQATPLWLVGLLNRFFSLVLGHPIQDGNSWVYATRGIILAQFFVACSFGVRAIKAGFDTIGVRHEEVARTLGCTRRQALLRVVLPMARNGIIAGAIMTWARGMAEFGPVLFFCGATRWKTEVLPVAMYLKFSVGQIEEAIALALIMILVSTVTLLAFKRLGGRGYLW
jgi:molybdate transport system permease protein